MNDNNELRNGRIEFHDIVMAAGKQAVAEAIERHRRLGQSIVVWRDGQVVTIEAEDIPPLVKPPVQSKIE